MFGVYDSLLINIRIDLFYCFLSLTVVSNTAASVCI